MSETKLEPCPKCGSEKLTQRDQHHNCMSDRSWDQVSSSIECPCGLKFSPYLCGSYDYEERRIAEEETRTAWNTRPIEAKLREELKALKQWQREAVPSLIGYQETLNNLLPMCGNPEDLKLITSELETLIKQVEKE